MGADEDLNVTHGLTMLGVDEVCILPIHVEEVLEHTEDKAWDGENLAERTKAELARQGYKEGNC